MAKTVTDEMNHIEGLFKSEGLKPAKWDKSHAITEPGWAVGHRPPRQIRVRYLWAWEHKRNSTEVDSIAAVTKKLRERYGKENLKMELNGRQTIVIIVQI